MERRLNIETGTAENGARITVRDSGMIGHIYISVSQWTPNKACLSWGNMTPGEARELAAELLALATRAEKIRQERTNAESHYIARLFENGAPIACETVTRNEIAVHGTARAALAAFEESGHDPHAPGRAVIMDGPFPLRRTP